MDKEKILSSIATRGNGEIYLGVVGAVRTGKSTFIKRFLENLVVPNIEDEYDLKCYKEAMEEYKKNPKTYTLEEVEKELGL